MERTHHGVVRTFIVIDFVGDGGENGSVSHGLWFLSAHARVVVYLFHHRFKRVSVLKFFFANTNKKP